MGTDCEHENGPMESKDNSLSKGERWHHLTPLSTEAKEETLLSCFIMQLMVVESIVLALHASYTFKQPTCIFIIIAIPIFSMFLLVGRSSLVQR